MAESTSNKLVADFIKVQENLPSLHKDGTANYGSYIKLETLMPKALTVLNKYNFVLVQTPTTLDGAPALKTSLIHTSGEVLEDTMLLMLDKQTAQGQGSGITYARRYALCAMLGIVADEDDDGQTATAQSGGATKPARSYDDTPSEKQINMAKDLMNQKGYEGLEAVALCKKLINKNVPTTKSEYSELIDKLLKEPAKAHDLPIIGETVIQ